MTFKLDMVKLWASIVLMGLCGLNVMAQETDSEPAYKKFPIIAGLQFQNFALPFKDMGSNFTHPGFFVGSEISYNEKETLIQQATIGGYLNREIGNGIYLGTQFGYRPTLHNNFYGELKAGLSYLRVFHPTQAYAYKDGEWTEIVGGKSQLAIPFDFGFGYSWATQMGEVSPYVSYQVTPALFYNETLPVNVYTSILVGLRIKLSN